MTDFLATLAAFLTHPTMLLLSGGAWEPGRSYGVGLWFKERGLAQTFPWGTFFIHKTGSFVLAIAVVLIRERMPLERQKWLLLVGTGFCGGYTTFSTFSVETLELAFVRKQPWLALGYALGSVAAGFLSAWLGWVIAEAAVPGPRL